MLSVQSGAVQSPGRLLLMLLLYYSYYSFLSAAFLSAALCLPATLAPVHRAFLRSLSIHQHNKRLFPCTAIYRVSFYRRSPLQPLQDDTIRLNVIIIGAEEKAALSSPSEISFCSNIGEFSSLHVPINRRGTKSHFSRVCHIKTSRT